MQEEDYWHKHERIQKTTNKIVAAITVLVMLMLMGLMILTWK